MFFPLLFRNKTLGLLFLLVCSFLLIDAVNRDVFKTCEQSSFCRRCRKVKPGKTPYQLLTNTLNQNESSISIDLFNKDTRILYILQLTALKDNTFRLHINEKNPLHDRYEPEYALQDQPRVSKLNLIEKTTDHITITSGENKVILYTNPFRVDLYSQNILVVSANARGLMRFEHYRTKPNRKPEQEENTENVEINGNSDGPGDGADDDPGAWEESFKTHHDSKPNGPEAIALDFSFPGAEHAYGVPEHADSFALKSTKQTDPYRLYNLDVFEYEVNERMSIYGAIPVLYAHGKERTTGIFWHNAAETWVDILSSADNNVVESIVNFVSRSAKKSQVDAHFMSEAGVIDVFFMLGPKPLDVFKQYTTLTGTAPLPQMFTLGYHQSRWNYNDQDDVIQVAENFDTHDLPLDVMWLDIEYTDSKKYFTWDGRKFPNPIEMVHNLTAKGRKLVVIIDPHIKRDPGYFLHNDATKMGYYIKTKDGKDYEGWCWPGSSSYLDFFDPAVREYYISQYSLDKFHGTTNDVYIWNDMNEPSVFNGPEVTMPKDVVHYGGWEHRSVHNINGLLLSMATYEALFRRSKGSLRPFTLVRSFFAGSQRYTAMWTGDNTGDWDHLRVSYPMCLSLAVSGMSFCGADVAGFFKNPDSELFIRWNQAGAWLPFYRQHSHIETKRREPWLFNEETLQIVKEAFRMRYSYLPLWYTLFREHEVNGTPVVRPLWAHYPSETETYAIDDEILIGDSILVRPVFQPSVTDVNVYFPGEGTVIWYDVDTMQPYYRPGLVNIPVTLHKIPVFQRGGSIVPRKMRIRRSTVAMKNDPYTLIVTTDSAGKANGTLYIDDEASFEYRHGKYLYLRLTFERNKLTSTFIDKLSSYQTESWLERVDIANPPKGVKSAILNSRSMAKVNLETKYNPNNNVLTVRKPGVNMGEEWSIELIH
ncbi:neutral alpha-glucosidase AB isoform X1 [Bombus terrestris]|uniref:Glucosidase II subunit alpha n=1 Tax=Bombus terrestris TaxID=30195 RepID=A0A9B2JEV7_BOMTE|nr:neutral alpha-glucosidase AB isoform X1 [Bombus terrestris]